LSITLRFRDAEQRHSASEDARGRAYGDAPQIRNRSKFDRVKIPVQQRIISCVATGKSSGRGEWQ
jgi:hypothetical protein